MFGEVTAAMGEKWEEEEEVEEGEKETKEKEMEEEEDEGKEMKGRGGQLAEGGGMGGDEVNRERII